jgi:uncharacterized protein (DUF1015 family)
LQIRGFSAWRPPRDLAPEVAAVPYDTVDTDEARAIVRENRRNFLRVSRAETDLPPGTDPHGEVVCERSARCFAEFQRDGLLVRDDEPAIYLYRQQAGSHVQRGIVACCHVADYRANVIRRHENTRPEKENDRLRHTEALRAHSGLVFLTYRDDAGVDAVAAASEAQPPLFDFTTADGVRHSGWRASRAAELSAAFARTPAAYIADGHHRAAAAARLAAGQRPGENGRDTELNWFMAILYPASQVRILAYNRCATDLNGMNEAQFLEAVGRRVRVTPDASPAPQKPGRISMYAGGRWYGLAWDEDPRRHPVSSLDVSRLQDDLLHPVLGIADPTRDRRIDFVAGARGTAALQQLVDSRRAAVAFSLHPVRMEQIMAVSDAGLMMPPKSTWFDPKPRSGLFVHTF